MQFIVSQDNGVPECLRNWGGKFYKRIQTNGDGACGIHAAFGELFRSELRHSNARGFLASTLGCTSDDVRRNCRNSQTLHDVMEWVWVRIVKPQARLACGLSAGNVDFSSEERMIWEYIKRDAVVASTCVQAVKKESEAQAIFDGMRQEIACAFGALCRPDMKEIFLRPLLVSMGIAAEYFDVEEPSIQNQFFHKTYKIDMMCVDCPRGQLYRQSVVEYCGTDNYNGFLIKVEHVISDMSSDNIEKAADVFEFSELVSKAKVFRQRLHHGASALVREPFDGFFRMIYPKYVAAMATDGYFLSDLELLLLCECAKTNAVIVRPFPPNDDIPFVTLRIHKWVMPDSGVEDFRLISIGGEIGASTVRGHFERLECVPVDHGEASKDSPRRCVNGKQRPVEHGNVASLPAQGLLEGLLEEMFDTPKEDEYDNEGVKNDDTDAEAQAPCAELSEKSTDDEGSDNDDVFGVSSCDASSVEPVYAQNFLYRWWLGVRDMCRLLRDDVLLPLRPNDKESVWTDVNTALVLPSWHCAFRGCASCSAGWVKGDSHEKGLWTHLWESHKEAFVRIIDVHDLLSGMSTHEEVALALYNAGLAEKERGGCPKVGVATDRRALLHLGETFYEENVATLMCFICGCKHVCHSGFGKFGEPRRKGNIEYRCDQKDLLRRFVLHSTNGKFWDGNLSYKKFKGKFGEAVQSDPQLQKNEFEWRRKVLRNSGTEEALCCPEDVEKSAMCAHDDTIVCTNCRIPVCNECWELAVNNKNIPKALANDNFIGYASKFIVEKKVTWLEATIAAPVFSGLVTYYVEGGPAQRRNLMDTPLGKAERSWKVRGNLFSFLLPWEQVMSQLCEKCEDGDLSRWPMSPDIACQVVRVKFAKGSDVMLEKFRDLHVRSSVIKDTGIRTDSWDRFSIDFFVARMDVFRGFCSSHPPLGPERVHVCISAKSFHEIRSFEMLLFFIVVSPPCSSLSHESSVYSPGPPQMGGKHSLSKHQCPPVTLTNDCE